MANIYEAMNVRQKLAKLDEATIKQYTGGEDITARELYQSAITFKPQFTMWLSCNDLPSVKDKSLFASDRVRAYDGSEVAEGTFTESPEGAEGQKD